MISVLHSWRWAKDCPKHVELILEINKFSVLHLVGSSILLYLHWWCTVKHKSSCYICLLNSLVYLPAGAACDAVQSGTSVTTSQKVQPQVHFHQTTRRHTPEDSRPHSDRHDDDKSPSQLFTNAKAKGIPAVYKLVPLQGQCSLFPELHVIKT